MPGKSDKVRVYPGATEDLPCYRVMPRDGGQHQRLLSWLRTPEDTDKARRKAALEAKARQLFNGHKQTYGDRRLATALGKAGMKSGHCQVRHLTARLGLTARCPKCFKVTTDSHHNEAISPNRLDRQFDAAAPNQAWATDITDIWALEGWLYLAVVMDLFSRQVVGWAAADHMRAELCASALQMAFWRRKPKPGLPHHRGRGSQYANHEYRKHLGIMKMGQSMSRKGDCRDNSPTERFFRSLKHGQLNHEKFKSKASAKLSIIDYLAFYNGKRTPFKIRLSIPVAVRAGFL